jgi:hypothetical protein
VKYSNQFRLQLQAGKIVIRNENGILTIQEAEMNETPVTPAPQKGNHAVAITAIIASAFVILACIAGIATPLIIAAMHIH